MSIFFSFFFSLNVKYHKLICSSVKNFLDLPSEGFQWSVDVFRFWIPKQVGSLKPLWTFLRRIPTTKTYGDNILLRFAGYKWWKHPVSFQPGSKRLPVSYRCNNFHVSFHKGRENPAHYPSLGFFLSLLHCIMLCRWTKSTQNSGSGGKSRVAYTKIMS